MAQQLALIEPIPLPDINRPTRTTSLPEWLVLRLAAAKPESKTVGGQYQEIITLPAVLIPTESQRSMISSYCRVIEDLCSQTPDSSEDAERAVLVVTSKMLLALASPKNSETGSEAKGEAYLAAVEDLPHWAVAAAVRGWYRGSCDQTERQPHDFRWAPAPAVLRKIAFIEMQKVKGRAIAMRKLLIAEPVVEYSDDHRATMLDRISGLFGGMTKLRPATPAQEAAE